MAQLGSNSSAWRRVLKTLPPALIAAVLSACEATVPSRVDTVIVNGRVVEGTGGEVRISRAGTTFDAQPGTTLEAGDEILTGPSAQAVLLLENGKVEVVLLEDTRVIVSSIFLDFGEAIVRILGELRETFEVESDYGAAGADDTEFIVRARRGSDYQCAVLEGRVRVRSPSGAWPAASVRTGQEAAGRPGTPISTRTLSRDEYNAIIERVNRIERIYRPNAMRLLMPDVEGLSEADARSILAAEGLSVARVIARITGRVPVGQVVAQSPATGVRLEPGAGARLEVEVEATTVPRLSGVPLGDAETRLARERLTVGEIRSEITGRFREGEVIRQQPNPGERVPVGSAVELWVEAPSVRVPDLRNLTINDARRALQNNKLQPGRIGEDITGRVAADTVLSQQPAAGTLVAPSSSVDMVVEIPSALVPRLERQPYQTAVDQLGRVGLRVGRVDRELVANVADGTVLRQGVAPQTRVELNTAVDLTVAERGVRVPNLAGMSRSSADRALRQRDLRSGGVSERAVNQAAGRIIDQSPNAGTLVRPGSTVRIVLSAQCEVPRGLRGKSLADAQELLASNNLRHRVVGGDENVYLVSPAEGTKVRCFSTVSLTLYSTID